MAIIPNRPAPLLQPPKPFVKPSPQPVKKEDVSKVDNREHLGNGDYLIGVVENAPKTHRVQLMERTDPSQFIRFYMKCNCGVEGRFHQEQQMRDQAEYHLQRHPR